MLLLPFEHLPGIGPLFCCQKTSTLSSCRIAQPKRVWQFGHDDKKRLFYTRRIDLGGIALLLSAKNKLGFITPLKEIKCPALGHSYFPIIKSQLPSGTRPLRIQK